MTLRDIAGRSGRTTLAVICLTLMLQSLAPPGYMAGSLEDGWPVVLCPDGLPADFLDHHHHHDATGSGHDVSLDGHCPLGGVLDGAVALTGSVGTGTATGVESVIPPYVPPTFAHRYMIRVSRGPPTTG